CNFPFNIYFIRLYSTKNLVQSLTDKETSSILSKRGADPHPKLGISNYDIIMVHSQDLLWGFSVFSLFLYLFNSITKAFSSSSSSSSSSSTVTDQQQEQDLMVIGNGDKKNKLMTTTTTTSMMKRSIRPGRLIVPPLVQTYLPCVRSEFEQVSKRMESKEVEVQGKDFCLASKKGRREVMEDGYGVLLDILGHSNHAFYAVIDGHGGREAMEYVAENLGKNIVKAMEADGGDVVDVEEAIRKGYLLTDKDFLTQGVRSGACAASVVIKNGELHIANVGDCRVVLSRNGVATPLTLDHRLTCREDERLRIENSVCFQFRDTVSIMLNSLSTGHLTNKNNHILSQSPCSYEIEKRMTSMNNTLNLSLCSILNFLD
ncbi:Probable protein phosphatase 2C 77, partial [Linum grandiflorum]